MLSIDTPEKGEPLYEEAGEYLRSLTLGKKARIEYAGNRRDKYGRLLGYLYIDSILVNAEIVNAGLAHLYLFKDTELNRRKQNFFLTLKKRRWRQKSVIGHYPALLKPTTWPR